MAASEVLFCSDFSANDEYLLKRAIQVAQTMKAGITLMHALDPLKWLPPGDHSNDFEVIKNQVRDALLGLVNVAGSDYESSVRILLESGHPSDLIPDVADRLDVRLIVLGAHGQGDSERPRTGANVSRIIRQTRRDALIVKTLSALPYQRVLVPLDFSVSGARCLHAARSLAPDAHFFLQHTCEIAYEGLLHRAGASRQDIVENRLREHADAKDSLEALAREAGLADSRVTIIVNHGHPGAKALSIEKDFDCDLVVVGKHGQSMIKDYLLGSVAATLIAETRSDVLVVS